MSSSVAFYYWTIMRSMIDANERELELLSNRGKRVTVL